MTEADRLYAPTTHSERVRAREAGTPPGWRIYTSEAPDDMRDGLLRSWFTHMTTRAKP